MSEDYWIVKKRKDVQDLKDIIKKKHIELEELVSKLAVEYPYFSNKKSIRMINDMRNAGHIIIEEDGGVKLSQS